MKRALLSNTGVLVWIGLLVWAVGSGDAWFTGVVGLITGLQLSRAASEVGKAWKLNR